MLRCVVSREAQNAIFWRRIKPSPYMCVCVCGDCEMGKKNKMNSLLGGRGVVMLGLIWTATADHVCL